MPKVRTELLTVLIQKAKRTEFGMIGIDINKHKLSNAEKRYLADKGLHLSEARYGELILMYPQKLRSEDLRRKVRKDKK